MSITVSLLWPHKSCCFVRPSVILLQSPFFVHYFFILFMFFFIRYGSRETSLSFRPYMAAGLRESEHFRLLADYSPKMQSASVAAPPQYCSAYGQNISLLLPLPESLTVVPEHPLSWNRTLPQNTFSDGETMPPHHKT